MHRFRRGPYIGHEFPGGPIPADRLHVKVRKPVFHHGNRCPLEGNRARKRMHRGFAGIDQCKFIGKKTPPAPCEKRTQCALSRFGLSAQKAGSTLPFHHRGMNKQPGMGMPRETPVDAPFKERNRHVQRVRVKGPKSVPGKKGLRAPPSPKETRTPYVDMKVGKIGLVSGRKISIEMMKVSNKRPDTRFQRQAKRADIAKKPSRFQQEGQLCR